MDVLQLAQGEARGQQREGDGRVVDLAAQPLAGEGEDLAVVEGELERLSAGAERRQRLPFEARRDAARTSEPDRK